MFGDTLPWIWNVPIKLMGMQPMDNAPGTTAERHSFFTLARLQPTRPLADNVINLVGAYRRDGPYPTPANSITLLCHNAGDQDHGALVIGSRTRRNFFEIRFALLVFAEKANRPFRTLPSGRK